MVDGEEAQVGSGKGVNDLGVGQLPVFFRSFFSTYIIDFPSFMVSSSHGSILNYSTLVWLMTVVLPG